MNPIVARALKRGSTHTAENGKTEATERRSLPKGATSFKVKSTVAKVPSHFRSLISSKMTATTAFSLDSASSTGGVLVC